MTRNAIEAELNALRAAKPTTIAAFATKRAERAAELEAMLAALPVETATTTEPQLDKLLARYEGGDQFDRGARRRGQVR